MIVYVVMENDDDGFWPTAVYSTLEAAMAVPYADVVPFDIDNPEWTVSGRSEIHANIIHPVKETTT